MALRIKLETAYDNWLTQQALADIRERMDYDKLSEQSKMALMYERKKVLAVQNPPGMNMHLHPQIEDFLYAMVTGKFKEKNDR